MSSGPVHVAGGWFRGDWLVGTEHGVATYHGVDSTSGAPVWLRLAQVDALPLAVRLRFEREVGVLAQVRRDRSLPVLAAGREGDALYLVQPRPRGGALSDRLGSGPLSVPSTLRIGIDVGRVLMALHAHGMVHGGLAPSSVLVEADDPVSRAVPVDLALVPVRPADDATATRPDLLPYLAPEVASARDGMVDERSDLYSLGALLVACLTNRAPDDAVEELRTAAPTMPRALHEVVRRLLRPDPLERYQSAEALLDDLQQIAWLVNSGELEPSFVVGRTDHRRRVTDPAFVGREQELSALRARLAAARLGSGGVVCIAGESGGGKSRLLDELGYQATRLGFEVLRGQAVDQAVQRPLTVLDGVAAALARILADDPAARSALVERLGSLATTLAVLLPQLAPALDLDTQGEVGPEQFGEQRSLAALHGLLSALGSQERPVLVVLDDCQWADPLAVGGLMQWQRSSSPDGRRVLVVAAYRSDEVDLSSPLRTHPVLERLVLPPLTADDIAALTESMAGILPEPVVGLVQRLSDGSPFMAAAVVRGLVESGSLVTDSRGWREVPERLDTMQAAGSAGELLARRVQLLSSATSRLLQAGAVLGKTFDLAEAVRIARLDERSGSLAVAELRQRRMVWVREHEGVAVFVHDKVREAVLDEMGVDVRQRMHRAVADRLLGSPSASSFDLAYHLSAAGLPAAALPHALAAADEARARHALEAAEANYRLAAEGQAAGGALKGIESDVLQSRIAEGLGDVLTLAGRYDEATPEYDLAARLANDRLKVAELKGKVGDLAFKQGDLTAARDAVESALRGLGRHVPRHGPTFAVMLLWELIVQVLHSVLPRRFVARRRRAGADVDFLAMRLYSRLAYVYWFAAGRAPCGWAHLRELNLAERYPDSAELAQAYSEHAPVATMLPWYSRGIRYAEQSLAIRRELGDVWGQGQSLHFLGVVHYAAGDFDRSLLTCREAIRLLDATGDRWESNTAAWHVALCEYRLGRLAEAAQTAQELHAAATAIGDHAAAGIGLSVWARATQGRVPVELVDAELAVHTEDLHTATELRLARALVLLAAGETAGAVTVLEEATREVRRKKLRQEYVAAAFPWLATALRLHAEALPPDQRRRAVRRAVRAARRADRLARWYANNRPHALRERGLAAALGGRTSAARRLLDRSVSVARAQGAGYELALSRLALAGLGAAPDEVAIATAGVAAFEGVVSAGVQLRPRVPGPRRSGSDTTTPSANA